MGEIFTVSTALNNGMNLQSTFKVMMYLFTTMLIGIATQLGELNYNLANISHDQWAGILIKALLPGLIAMRALFDTLPTNPPGQ